MATNYYKSLFENGYQTPKPNKTAAVPAARPYTAPTVAKNTITQPSTLKTGLQKQNNLTQAGNLYEQNVNDVLSGAKKAPNVQNFENQVTRLNSQASTGAKVSAQQQAAAAGLKPGTAAYNRLLSSNQSQAASQNLDRQTQAATMANQSYQDFLNKGNQLENDAYGKATAERAYGTERDDVLYGRNLNERDYGDSRDDKQNALDKEALDYNTLQDLNQFNMANTIDRQNRQDYETDRGFDYGAAKDADAIDFRDSQALDDRDRFDLQRGDLNSQWEQQFGSSEDQRSIDNTFRDSEFSDSKYRYATDRGDQLGRDAVSNDQWSQEFGASREDKASDNAFRDSQATDDRDRFDLTRGDNLTEAEKEQARWESEFGANREDRASDNQYRDMVFNTQTGQWERQFSSSEDQRSFENEFTEKEFDASRQDKASDDQYRDMVFNTQTGQWEKEFSSQEDQRSIDNSNVDRNFNEDTRRYDTDRQDNLTEAEKEQARWESEFGANREDRASDDQFRDKEFLSNEDQRAIENSYEDRNFTEDTRRYDTDRQDNLTEAEKEEERWKAEFGANRDDRASDDQFRDKEFLSNEDQRAIENSYEDRNFNEDTRRYDTDRQDNLSQAEIDQINWEKEFGEDTRRYDTNREDTQARNSIEDARYDQEYADSRNDLQYANSQAEYADLLNSLGSEAAKQAMQQARIAGGDYKTAYTNLFGEDGKLKPENRDISPDEAKLQSRVDELKMIYPEKSDEEIRQIVSNDMKMDYEAERSPVQQAAETAASLNKIKNISSPEEFKSLSSSDIAAIADSPELISKYKSDGLIKTDTDLKGLLRLSDADAKGIEKGTVVQMKDGTLVQITTITSKKSDRFVSDERQMTIMGTDPKTGKEVKVYDSGKVKL